MALFAFVDVYGSAYVGKLPTVQYPLSTSREFRISVWRSREFRISVWRTVDYCRLLVGVG